MAVFNPSFEDAGLLLGEAEHWTLASVTSLESIAGFGSMIPGGPELAWEGFERWGELWLALEDVPVVRAFFDSSPEGLEDFEKTWDNDLYLFELPAQLAIASFGLDDVEACEAGWGNDGCAMSWVEVTSVAGAFDGEPREDFEDQWHGNQAFAWAWGAVTSAAALFDAEAQAREDFENDWAPATTL